jgi:alpha-glucosidase
LPVDTMAWCSDSTVYYEGEFTRQRVDQIVCKMKNKLCMPVTFELVDGTYAAISEADVMRYSGMTVRPDNTYTLKAIFEDNLNGRDMTDLIETPWRVVMTGPGLNALVNCDLIHNVCLLPDARLFPDGMDTEWVKAGTGRRLWQWWAYLTTGTHWSLQKKFLDHAARLNCDFYMVDEGWEHLRQEWFEPGVTGSWQGLKELCEYGESRGVGILIWRSWHPLKNWHFPGLETEAKREELFLKCAEVGVKGVKIDFMNSESHDRLEFYQDCLRKSAEYKIAVNFYGANKPAGESHTWPDEVTREGILTLEYNLCKKR